MLDVVGGAGNCVHVAGWVYTEGRGGVAVCCVYVRVGGLLLKVGMVGSMLVREGWLNKVLV